MITTVIDPVCKMSIDRDSSQFSSQYNGQAFYFDSQQCKDQFDENSFAFSTIQEP